MKNSKRKITIASIVGAGMASGAVVAGLGTVASVAPVVAYADGGVARVGGLTYETLQAAVDAASDNGTVEVLSNVDLGGATLSVTKKLTFVGAGTENPVITGTTNNAVILLLGSGDVTFNGVDVTATNGHCIQAGNKDTAYSGKLTVSNSTLTSKKRGISVYESAAGCALEVNDSVIQSTQADPTSTYTTGDDSRGIALWASDGVSLQADISGTVIQGYSYCVNVAGNGSVTLNMTGGGTYGRDALNTWVSDSTFTLTGVDVHGLNNQTGPTEGFACIVDNYDASDNTYRLIGCSFTARLSEAAATAEGSTASEHLIDLRGTGSEAFIEGATTYDAYIGSAAVATTDDGYSQRFGLIYTAARFDQDNSIDIDATASDDLDAVIQALPNAVATDSAVYSNGTTFGSMSNVYYYWDTANGQEGSKAHFDEPFDNGWLADGEYIRLTKDVTLDKDLSTDKSFSLLLDGHQLDAGDYTIALAEGVTVTSDSGDIADVFSAPEGFKVKKQESDGSFLYSVVAATEITETTPSNESLQYDGTDHTEDVLSGIVVKAGEATLTADDYDVTVDPSPIKNAGEYTITVTAKDTSDYSGSMTATVTIGKAPLSVSVHNKTKRAGEEDPTFTGTATGLLGDDTISSAVTFSRSSGETPGQYTIDAKAKNGSNYDVTVTKKGTLTIKIGFRDVDAETPHQGDINWLADEGIAAGWETDDPVWRDFRPEEGTVRADMAAFLFRMGKRAGIVDDSWQPQDATKKTFSDVTEDTAHAKEIWWLAETGISTGWKEGDGTKTFRPYNKVVRQDMAAFLFRLAKEEDLVDASWEPTAADKAVISDVSDSTPHAREVRWLVSVGVSRGWKADDGTTEFRGMKETLRQDMAAFLHRLADLG